MTRTTPAAGTAKALLTDSAIAFWSLVVGIVLATLLLSGWTAAQAAVINGIVDGNGTQHPSIRQLERAGSPDEQQHLSIRQLERAGEARVAQVPQPSIRQVERAEQVRADELARLDASDTKRFANQVTVAEDTTPVDFAGVTDDDLKRLEHSELRRFRNRAPVDAMIALDDAIAQLATTIG
jgi:hypothetical protein